MNPKSSFLSATLPLVSAVILLQLLAPSVEGRVNFQASLAAPGGPDANNIIINTQLWDDSFPDMRCWAKRGDLRRPNGLDPFLYASCDTKYLMTMDTINSDV
ncbi:unnamed protein product [Calypogeia fissa]